MAHLLPTFGLLAAAGATLTVGSLIEKDDAKCCDIAVVVRAKGYARDYLIGGLAILKYQGYDSAGIVTLDEKDRSLVHK